MTKHSSTGLVSEQPRRAVVVSYVPFLKGEPGKVMAADDPHFLEILTKIDQGHDGHVDACLWMADANGVFPVFVMKDAHAIADHLLAWSEGNPADWFEICFAEMHGRYVAGLFPNVAASVGRFEAAHRIVHGDVTNVDGYEIVFRPLTFISGPKHSFRRIKGMIPASAMVGFVEPNEFDPLAPERLTMDAVRRVGPFRVCWNAKPFAFDISGMIEQQLQEGIE